METIWPTIQLETYYMERWNCHRHYLTTLDWSTYDNIFQTLKPSLQVFSIKTMSGWLPVRHHLNKMTTAQFTCPMCHHDETVPHLFQCSKRKLWQEKFLQQLEEKLVSMKTHLKLRTTITTHYQQLFTDTNTYHHIRQFTVFVGLFPTDWKHQHSIDCQGTQNTMNKWARQLGKWVIHQSHELWLARNTSIHDKDKRHSTMDTILNQKIRHLYSLQEEIGYHDRDMFSHPLEERLKLSYHQKMTWLTQTTKTMKISMEEYAEKKTTGQQDIRKFFQTRQKSQ